MVEKSEIRLTLKQLSNIKHALGSETCYRNHFNTGNQDESWEELVRIGYATKRNIKQLGGVTYFVTQQAIDDLKYIIFNVPNYSICEHCGDNICD